MCLATVTTICHMIMHLSQEDARRCLKDLVCGIDCALRELHSMGLSHNDIRLDNIYFDSKYQPILIDFDRSTAPHGYQFKTVCFTNSCMYKLAFNGGDGKKKRFFTARVAGCLGFGEIHRGIPRQTLDRSPSKYHRKHFCRKINNSWRL